MAALLSVNTFRYPPVMGEHIFYYHLHVKEHINSLYVFMQWTRSDSISNLFCFFFNKVYYIVLILLWFANILSDNCEEPQYKYRPKCFKAKFSK